MSQSKKKEKKNVAFKNSFEVATYNTVITDRNKQSLIFKEYNKLLTEFTLEQYIKLGFSPVDKYSIYMAYKHILDIYNLLLKERNMQPFTISLHPIVRPNNNNEVTIINKYYTDELYIEKIQILHAILKTPLDTDHKEKKKDYILRKRYDTLDKYITPYKFNSVTMDNTTKNNIYLCYGYLHHIIDNILPSIKNDKNKELIENINFLYTQLLQVLSKIIKNYDIQGPEINEYKDILIEFENIKRKGYMVENKTIRAENIPYSTPKEHLNSYDPSIIEILFLRY